MNTRHTLEVRGQKSEVRGRMPELLFAGWLSLALLSTAGWGAEGAKLEAHTSTNGTLSLIADGKPVCDFGAGLFDENWRSVHAGAIGDNKIAMKTGMGVELKGEAAFTANPNGTVSAEYSFTPTKDVVLNSLNVSADFQIAALAGTKWKMDEAEGTFPAEHKDTALRAAKIRTLKLAPTGAPELTVTFSEPTSVLLQDNRQWNTQTFSVRIGLAGNFKQGAAAKFGYTLSAGGPLLLTRDGPVTIVAGPDWIPLKTELDIKAGSALDFSSMHLTDAPAGKHGRVICREDGQFVFENDRNTPRRFYGVNLCFSGQYMSHAEADRLAERFARLGYNAVRIHHYEGLLTQGKKSTALNDERIEQLDYLFAALAKRGLYITTDLFVSRPVPYKDVGIDKPGNAGMDEFKMLVPVVPGAWENWKAFSKTFLEHVNTHTGKRHADDPALAWLSMINEGNFGNFTKQMQTIPEWKTLWNAWLKTRYGAREKLALAWGGALKKDEDFESGSVAAPNNVYAGNARARDENIFLAEKEREMVLRMKDFLRNEIHCAALITNSNAWTNHVTDQYKRIDYDYVDDHFYVDHPQFLQGDWRLPSRCDNNSPIAAGATGGRTCAFTRVFGKPFTITEYNYAGPGRFRGVGGILTGAMGSLQGWAGIWRFAYSHDHSNLFAPSKINYFDMVSDPLGQAAERASICLYLRGDMKMAPGVMPIEMKESELKCNFGAEVPKGYPEKIPNLAPSWHWAAWITCVGTDIQLDKVAQEITKANPKILRWPLYWDRQGLQQAGPYAYDAKTNDIFEALHGNSQLAPNNPTDPTKNVFRSETGEITIDAPRDMMTLDTPKTAGGYARAGSTIVTKDGGVSIAIEESDATAWVSALDGEPIASSKHLLATHLTDLQNTEIKYAETARRTLLDWGKLPHLVRNGKAQLRIKLDDPGQFEVWALSTGGKRLRKIEARGNDGKLEFTAHVGANPDEGAQMLYEIVRK